MDSHLRTTSDIENNSVTTTIRTSCDACRKKKLRCELVQDRCAQCIKHDRSCTFTPVKTKTEPRRPPGYKHIEALEGRLKRMEEIMKRQGSAPLADGDKDGGQRTTHHDKKRKQSRTSPNDPESSRGQKRTRRQNHHVTFNSPPDSPSSNTPTPESFQNATSREDINPQLPVPDWKLTAVPDILEASITVLYRVISHSQYTLPTADLGDLEQVVRLLRTLRTLGLSTGGSIEVPLKELVDEATMAAGRQEQGNTGLGGGDISVSDNRSGGNGINTVDDFIKRIVDGANCGNADNWV